VKTWKLTKIIKPRYGDPILTPMRQSANWDTLPSLLTSTSDQACVLPIDSQIILVIDVTRDGGEQ
jgi:hypothetical protein